MGGVQVEALDSRAAESAVREMEREMHAALGAAMRRAREAAAAVRISGATGENAGPVDGLFELTDEAGNGPVWKKCGAELYLYRAHEGSWFVSGAASKDARKAAGWARSELLGLGSLPTEACEWEVFLGDKWEAQRLRVRCFFSRLGEQSRTQRAREIGALRTLCGRHVFFGWALYARTQKRGAHTRGCVHSRTRSWSHVRRKKKCMCTT